MNINYTFYTYINVILPSIYFPRTMSCTNVTLAGIYIKVNNNTASVLDTKRELP